MLLFSPDILSIAADRGLQENFAPLCVVAGSAASALGRLVCPALSDKAGRKPVLLGICAGLGAGSVLFGFAGGWLLVAAYAGLTFCYSGGAAVQPALNTDLFGLPHAGINYGLLALGMSAGSFAELRRQPAAADAGPPPGGRRMRRRRGRLLRSCKTFVSKRYTG